MSGIEPIAGLALGGIGALPLFLSAAQNYKELSLPFRRYKNFVPEAARFQKALLVQQTIFRSQCRILLEAIVPHDVASSILDGADHPSVSHMEIEEQLVELLGGSKVTCVSTIETIKEHLQEIQNECQEFEAVVIRGLRVLRNSHQLFT